MTGRYLLAATLWFAALFTGGAFLVLFWVMLESLYIKGLTWTFLLRYSLQVTLLVLVVMVAMLTVYVRIRLGRLENEAGQAGGDERVCRRLLRLPAELFWLTVGYGCVIIPVYHIAHYVVEGHSLLHVEAFYRLNFIRSFLYQLTVTLSAAILHYAVSRRLIRPLLQRLSDVKGDGLRSGSSFLSKLAAAFVVLLLVSLFSILWYVIMADIRGVPVAFSVIGPVILLDLIFSVSIFVLLAIEFRRELQVLIGSIRSLLGGDRSKLYAKMPILSDDEVGQLAVTFNRLQDRLVREYDDLNKELRLARQVQLQLLPDRYQAFGAYEAAALSESRKGVGSGFYDMIPLGEGTFAIVAGNVSGAGLPAALQMSAALLLLRAEAQREDAPSAVLARLEQAMSEAFPEGESTALALLVVDAERHICRVAVRGRMNVIRQCGGRRADWSADRELPFLPGDRYCLYSDAAAEAVGAEMANLQPSADAPLESQLAGELSSFRSLPPSENGDLTLMLIERKGGVS